MYLKQTKQIKTFMKNAFSHWLLKLLKEQKLLVLLMVKLVLAKLSQ
jgi:hypothetical protein